jgi:hypothetical protein
MHRSYVPCAPQSAPQQRQPSAGVPQRRELKSVASARSSSKAAGTPQSAHSASAGLRAALDAAPLPDIVREVITCLVARRSFGAPITLLQDEYSRQMQGAALQHVALPARASKPDDELRGPAIFVDSDLQEQHLQLHAEHTKLAMASIAKDERLVLQSEMLTELHRTVRALEKATAAVDRPNLEEASSSDTAASAVASAAGYEQLNRDLSQRCEMLEHNMSMGLVFCERDLQNAVLGLQAELGALSVANAELAHAYLDVSHSNEEAQARAGAAEASLGAAVKRAEKLEKDNNALRAVYDRNKLDGM